MSDKDLAADAAAEGFKEGVQRLTAVLFDGWIIAKSQPEKDQALQRFQNGLSLLSEAHGNAQKAIDRLFAGRTTDV